MNIPFFQLPANSVAAAGLLLLALGPLGPAYACQDKGMGTHQMAGMQQTDQQMPMCCQRKRGESAQTMPEHSADTRASKQAQSGSSALTALATDPVCSMTVDPKTAEKSEYKGKMYYFCNREHKNDFDKTPEKYVGKKDEAKQ